MNIADMLLKYGFGKAYSLKISSFLGPEYTLKVFLLFQICYGFMG